MNKMGESITTVDGSSDSNDGRYYGYRPSSIEVDARLAVGNWNRWKTRVQMVDAMTIKEATALTFGVRPASISDLSEETSPTKERFDFRLNTVIASAMKSQIKLMSDEAMQGTPWEDRLIVFSDFMRFVKAGEKTSICKELIDIAIAAEPTMLGNTGNCRSQNDVSDTGNSETWKDQVRREADALWREWSAAGKGPTKNNIKVELAIRCANQGVKTPRNIPPKPGNIFRHVLQKWTPPTVLDN